MGFKLAGDSCALGLANANFADNKAHSCLVGLWFLQGSDAGCTQIVRFAAYLNWDFGIITATVRLSQIISISCRKGDSIVVFIAAFISYNFY